MYSILPRDDLVVPAATPKTTTTATTRRQTSSVARTTSRPGTVSRTGTAVNPSASTSKPSSSTRRSLASATSNRPYTVLTTTIPITPHSGVTVTHSTTRSAIQAGVGQTVKDKPRPKTSKAAIAGAVCGGLAVVILLGLVIFFVWWRRRTAAKRVGRVKNGIAVEPFTIEHIDSPQSSTRKNPLPLPSTPVSAYQTEPVHVGLVTALSPGIPRSPPPDYLFHAMDTRQHPPSTYPPSTPVSTHSPYRQSASGPIGYPESHPTLEGSNIHILGGKSPIDRYERHGRIAQYRW